MLERGSNDNLPCVIRALFTIVRVLGVPGEVAELYVNLRGRFAFFVRDSFEVIVKLNIGRIRRVDLLLQRETKSM